MIETAKATAKAIMQPQTGYRTVSILRMVFFGSLCFTTVQLAFILWVMDHGQRLAWDRIGTMAKIAPSAISPAMVPAPLDILSVAGLIGALTAQVSSIGIMVITGQVRKSNETTRAVRETEIAKAAANAGPDSTVTVTGKGGE